MAGGDGGLLRTEPRLLLMDSFGQGSQQLWMDVKGKANQKSRVKRRANQKRRARVQTMTLLSLVHDSMVITQHKASALLLPYSCQ